MQGNLRDFSLAEVLQFIALGRRDGVLELQTELGKHWIVVRNGVIVGVDAASGGVLHQLTEANLVPATMLDEALAESRREGRDLGAVLLQTGRVTKTDWQGFVHRLLERLLYWLFSLTDAPFAFQPVTPTLPPLTFDLPVDRVVLQGSRWAELWHGLRPAVAALDAKYVATMPPARIAGLGTPAQQQLLHLLQRPLDVYTLAQQAGLAILDAGRAVAEFVAAGYVRRVT